MPILSHQFVIHMDQQSWNVLTLHTDPLHSANGKMAGVELISLHEDKCKKEMRHFSNRFHTIIC